MLLLVAFAAILSAVYIAIGEEEPHFLFSTVTGEELEHHTVLDNVESLFPDPDPEFYLGPYEDEESTEKRKQYIFEKNTIVDDNAREIFSTKPPLRKSLFPEDANQVWDDKELLKQYFAYNFIKKIKACEKLSKAFEVNSFNATSLSSLFYDETYEKQSHVCAPDVPISAQVVSDAVEGNFDKLLDDTLLRIFADSIGHYLFYRNYLNQTNVACLSEQYFTFMERSINSVKHPTPEANIRAVCRAFAEFLTSLGHYNPYTTFLVTEGFASQFFTL